MKLPFYKILIPLTLLGLCGCGWQSAGGSTGVDNPTSIALDLSDTYEEGDSVQIRVWEKDQNPVIDQKPVVDTVIVVPPKLSVTIDNLAQNKENYNVEVSKDTTLRSENAVDTLGPVDNDKSFIKSDFAVVSPSYLGTPLPTVSTLYTFKKGQATVIPEVWLTANTAEVPVKYLTVLGTSVVLLFDSLNATSSITFNLNPGDYTLAQTDSQGNLLRQWSIRVEL